MFKQHFPIAWDLEAQRYIILDFGKVMLKCDNCGKPLGPDSDCCIKLMPNDRSYLFCIGCRHLEIPVRRYGISGMAIITDSMPNKFQMVSDYEPLLQDGSITVWDTDRLEGHIIDKTIQADKVLLLEGAQVGKQLEDRSQPQLEQPKDIDSFFKTRGIVLKPGVKTQAELEADQEWQKIHGNA